MSRFSACNVDHNTIKLSIILINHWGIFSLDVSLQKLNISFRQLLSIKAIVHCVRQFQKLAFLIEKKWKLKTDFYSCKKIT